MCTYLVQPVCTSLLFILLFIKSQYTVFAHLIVLHFLFYCTFYSYFSFLPYTVYALVLCYLHIIYIFILLHCPLSGPDLIYISLLIIPCIIYNVTNKETLNLEPWTSAAAVWCNIYLKHMYLVLATLYLYSFVSLFSWLWKTCIWYFSTLLFA